MPRSFKRESAFEREGRRWAARVLSVEESPTRAPVVEGWLRRGEVREVGMRTRELASLARAVSRGEASGGRATFRTNVLYVAGLDTPQEWAYDVWPFMGSPDRWFRVVFRTLKLDESGDLVRLRTMIEFGGVGLVVLDPLGMMSRRCDPAKALAAFERVCREKDAAGLWRD